MLHRRLRPHRPADRHLTTGHLTTGHRLAIRRLWPTRLRPTRLRPTRLRPARRLPYRLPLLRPRLLLPSRRRLPHRLPVPVCLRPRLRPTRLLGAACLLRTTRRLPYSSRVSRSPRFAPRQRRSLGNRPPVSLSPGLRMTTILGLHPRLRLRLHAWLNPSLRMRPSLTSPLRVRRLRVRRRRHRRRLEVRRYLRVLRLRLRLRPIPLRQHRLHGLDRAKRRHPFVRLGGAFAIARTRMTVVEGLPVLDVVVLARLTPTPACPGHT